MVIGHGRAGPGRGGTSVPRGDLTPGIVLQGLALTKALSPGHLAGRGVSARRAHLSMI